MIITHSNAYVQRLACSGNEFLSETIMFLRNSLAVLCYVIVFDPLHRSGSVGSPLYAKLLSDIMSDARSRTELNQLVETKITPQQCIKHVFKKLQTMNGASHHRTLIGIVK